MTKKLLAAVLMLAMLLSLAACGGNAAPQTPNSVVPGPDASLSDDSSQHEETTEPAPETTEPGSSSETGDSFVIFAAIAAVAVLGVAVVAKRREN